MPDATRNLVVRIVQVGGPALIVLLILTSLASAWTAYQVRGLSGDVRQAQARLPDAVGRRLPANAGLLDAPQVMLVRYSSGLARGAAVLISTVPSQKLFGVLSLTPGIRVGSASLRDLSTPAAIAALRAQGVPVTHVALVDVQDVSPLVDAVGGISISNPAAFTATTADGRVVPFDRGTLHMNGAQAAVYMRAVTSHEPLEDAGDAVLLGVVKAALAPSGVGRLQSIGHGLASSTATDLTTADVLGLVELRLRDGEAVECHAATPGALAAGPTQSAVDQILGRAAAGTPPCTARRLAAAPVVPPAAVARAAQHYGWQLFAGLALVLATVAALAAAALTLYWPTAEPYPTPSRSSA